MSEDKPECPPELPQSARLLKAAFAFPQADLWLGETADGTRVWKTWYRGKGFMKRRFGRFLAQRETRILKELETTGAVPRVYTGSRQDTIEMEALKGHPLAELFLAGDSPPLAYFDALKELVREMHAHGITHGDLGLNNLLFNPERPTQPLLLDFTQSLQFRMPPRWGLGGIYRMACRIDLARVAKIKNRMFGGEHLEPDERHYVEHPPWYLRLGRATRKKLYHPFRRRLSANDPDDVTEPSRPE